MTNDNDLAEVIAIVAQANASEVDHVRQIALGILDQLQEAQDDRDYWRDLALSFIRAEGLRESAVARYRSGEDLLRGSM